MTSVLFWLWNVLVWIDQGLNVIFAPLLNALLRPELHFGSPDETLSSVFGKNVRVNRCRVCRWICMLLHVFDKNHCENSIEDDEGAER